MGVVTQDKMTREQFRELHPDNEKPHWELIDGEPEQKAMGKKPHASLQIILGRMLDDLGFIAYTELTLEIDEHWEPVPDVAATLEPEPGDGNQLTPPAIAIEILSPTDRFVSTQKKCARYAEWGVMDILVFDPVAQKAWYWHFAQGCLIPVNQLYALRCQHGAMIDIAAAFHQLNKKLTR